MTTTNAHAGIIKVLRDPQNSGYHISPLSRAREVARQINASGELKVRVTPQGGGGLVVER